MQVVVLNGVNLDVLARRDPAVYGGLSLSELETRIYEWASELGCHVRCRQTNHEGEYVGWCHDAMGPTASSSTPARGRTTPMRSATPWSSCRRRSSRFTSPTSKLARTGVGSPCSRISRRSA